MQGHLILLTDIQEGMKTSALQFSPYWDKTICFLCSLIEADIKTPIIIVPFSSISHGINAIKTLRRYTTTRSTSRF